MRGESNEACDGNEVGKPRIQGAHTIRIRGNEWPACIYIRPRDERRTRDMVKAYGTTRADSSLFTTVKTIVETNTIADKPRSKQ